MCETPRVDRQIHTAGSPCKTGNTDAFPLCPGGESNPTPSLITPGQTHHNKAHEIIKNMTNSAHILHDIFITWNTAPKPQERETTPLATHRRAVQLLDDVEDIAIRLADDTPAASVYQKHFPTWAAFIYNYPYNWQSKNTINENSLDQLYISNYALLQVRDQLLRLDGIGDITIFGARDSFKACWTYITAVKAGGPHGAARPAA